MGGECVGKAEQGREARSVRARAEDPERHLETRPGNRADRLILGGRAEEQLQVLHVVRESVGAQRVAAERPGRELIGAGSPTKPEVDAAGVERLERPELLRDHERRVVRQHDPARPDPDRRRARREIPGDDSGRGARDRLHVVVLGDPVALVAEPLGVSREIEAVAQRVAGGRSARDRSEVEDGEGNRSHRADVTRRIWSDRRPNHCRARDVSVVVCAPAESVATGAAA